MSMSFYMTVFVLNMPGIGKFWRIMRMFKSSPCFLHSEIPLHHMFSNTCNLSFLLNTHSLTLLTLTLCDLRGREGGSGCQHSRLYKMAWIEGLKVIQLHTTQSQQKPNVYKQVKQVQSHVWIGCYSLRTTHTSSYFFWTASSIFILLEDCLIKWYEKESNP